MADTPLDAYWAFFTNFNTRDATAFSSALNYPHVRLSPRRPPGVVATLEEHAAMISWDRFIADGWDHTIGVEPEMLQAGEDRAHIRGGWTRYTADDQPILTNYVTYIVTKLPTGWGIQSRFGIDGGVGETDADVLAAVEQFVSAVGSGDARSIAERMHFPNIKVGVGRIESLDDFDSIRQSLESDPLPVLEAPQSSIVYGGDDAATVMVDADCDGGRFHGLFFLSRSDEGWGVQARSTFVA